MTPTGRDSDKFMLRLPDGMRDRIADAAKANGRSMNAEIVATLEENYPPEPLLDELIGYARDLAKAHLEAPSNHVLRQLVATLSEIAGEIPEVAGLKEDRKNQRGRDHLRRQRKSTAKA